MAEPPPSIIDASRLYDAFAGFCGALVFAIRYRFRHAWKIVATVMIGTMAAHFLTNDIVNYVHIGREAGGFLVGFGFYAASDIIIQRISVLTGGTK